jgi:hypothetical protein
MTTQRLDHDEFLNSVEYAESAGLLRHADTEREGFGWRIVPPGSLFWKSWKVDKVGMKARGYRVMRRDDGSYMVCREEAMMFEERKAA